MMCKQKVTKIKLFIPAAAAAATPPFGPILGQYGINTVQFCKEFNASTEGLTLFYTPYLEDDFGGFILSVDIIINEDRSYKYIINKPPVSFLLRLLTNTKVGAPRVIAGTLKRDELIFLSQFKFPSLSLRAGVSTILGVCRSIGIRVVD